MNNKYLAFSGIGFEFLAYILLFSFIGIQADKYLKISDFPIFTIVMIFIGMALAFKALLARIKAMK